MSTTLIDFAQSQGIYEPKYQSRLNLSIWIRFETYHTKTSSSIHTRRQGEQAFEVFFWY